MSAQGISAPEIDLLIRREIQTQIILFSAEAYERFRSAKLFAEVGIGLLLKTFSGMPAFKVTVYGIRLEVGFDRHQEKFFIGGCVDLIEFSEPPNPPGGGLPTALMPTNFFKFPDFQLRVLDLDKDREELGKLNLESDTIACHIDHASQAQCSRQGVAISVIGSDARAASIQGISVLHVDSEPFTAVVPHYADYSGTDIWGTSGARFEAVRNTGNESPAALPGEVSLLNSYEGAFFRAEGDFRCGSHLLSDCSGGVGRKATVGAPNLLNYSGSGFVVDLNGEKFAATADARSTMGQSVFVLDPFEITGATAHCLNWFDMLIPENPNVVAVASLVADMMVIKGIAGMDRALLWDHDARDLLRGLLIYVSGLPTGRRSMAELRRILSTSEEDFTQILLNMVAEPECGRGIPAFCAQRLLSRSRIERASVQSVILTQTAWLDDPFLSATLARSDFNFADVLQRPVTVYLVIPRIHLRESVGFIRGFIALALTGAGSIFVRSPNSGAFFLDDFSLVGSTDYLDLYLSLIRCNDAQLGRFVYDLDKLRSVPLRRQVDVSAGKVDSTFILGVLGACRIFHHNLRIVTCMTKERGPPR